MHILATITSDVSKVFIFFGYFTTVLLIAFFTHKKQRTATDFILGDRSSNFWLTALSAQASDMSSWLFLAYPALIFTGGVFSVWAAIGLIVGMMLNWHYIAPKLRKVTEELGSLTLSSYFEKRFCDESGIIRVLSGMMSVVFFTFYISSGLVAMGVLVESLFGLSYNIGIVAGLLIVVIYVLLGGFKTVAWIDLIQGFFLLGVIIFIPVYLLVQVGGFAPVMKAAAESHRSTSLLPEYSLLSIWKIFTVAAGWGIGYFGQPHILTKFMGINSVGEMRKAKYLGMGWMTLALGAATLVGLLGIFFFQGRVIDPQQVILYIVHDTMAPFFAGLVLCAILAATTNVMAAQILVIASNLSEDFYKGLLAKKATSQQLLRVSRMSVVIVALFALIIAFFKISTIYRLVLYSWSGLGASFGPLLVMSLYLKNINKYGAIAGILTGGVVSGIWPYVDTLFGLDLSPIIPGCVASLIAIYIVSFATSKKMSPIQV